MSKQYNVYHSPLEYIVCADSKEEALDNVMNHRNNEGQEEVDRDSFCVELIKYDCHGVYNIVTG